MLSLRYQYLEYFNLFYLNLNYSIFLGLFLVIFITNFFTFSYFYNKYSSSADLLNFYTFFLFFFLICYTLKFLYLMNVDFWGVENFNSLTYFSDVLVLLVLTTAFISWFYLSERFLGNLLAFALYFFFFLLCTLGMVSTDNLLSVFLYFELIFVPSIFFVYQFSYSKKAIKTIVFLLTWTLIGSLLILFTISYLYFFYHSLNLRNIIFLDFSFLELSLLSSFILLGFGVKIPLWPLHYWLTKVHVEAPTGFSIFLSGFLVKTAFYCLVYFYLVFSVVHFKWFFVIVVLWGIVDASVRMWSSFDIKKLIAFATIQEMNLIVLFFFFIGALNSSVLNLFLLVHGILSAFFFFLVDQVQKRTSTRNAIQISGLFIYIPLITILVWFSLLIFRGFPTFIKFIIEWELSCVVLKNYHTLGFFLFFVISVFSVSGFARTWFSILYGQPHLYLMTNDILKKDYTLGVFLIMSLSFLNFFFFFIGYCFISLFF